jgi:hypothetical protein
MAILILFFILVLAWGTISTIAAKNKAQILAAQNAEFTGSHQGWDVYISPYNRGVLGLNRDGGEVVLGVVTASKRYKLTDIATVEVLRDGASITSTNRGSQLAGAALGGLAFGGVGMIVGGLSGSTRSQPTIQSVSIKVIVDDRVAPVHVIEFFRSPAKGGIDAGNPHIKPSLDQADRFHAFLVNALRSEAQPAATLPPPNTAAQIGKLWELKQVGALTEIEFASQKALLLGSGPPRIDWS